MIKHVVLFALDGFDTDAQKHAHLLDIKKALEALPSEIDALRSMNVFINENPAEPYDFVLEACLDTLEALPLYADHPAHVRVVDELIKSFKKSRAAIDYSI